MVTEPQTRPAAAAGRARAGRAPRPFNPELERVRLAGQLLIALVLAVLGQLEIARSPNSIDGALLFAAAVALFVWAVERERRLLPAEDGAQLPLPAAPQEHFQGIPRLLSVREGLAFGVVIVLAAVDWLLFAGNRFTVQNLAAWVVTLGLFAAAFFHWPSVERLSALRPRSLRDGFRVHLTPTFLAIAVLILIGAFYRYHDLARTPIEMISDHAEKLLDVNDVLDGTFRVFFPRNTGREALQFYLTAGTIRLFDLPLGHVALKLGTALFGVFTLPWIYLLGKELVSRQVGLIAVALASVSLWANIVARFGLRFPFTAAFAAPTLYFLIRAFKYNRRNDWLLCGLFLGIGLHTYTPFRVAPVLLVALVGLKLLLDLARARSGSRIIDRDPASPLAQEASSLTPSFWVNAALAGVLAALVFLPLGRFAVDEPSLFWYRALTRSSGIEHEVQSPVVTFLENNKNALLMFNYRGDINWTNNVPGDPAVDVVTAALMVLGAAYVLWRLVRHRDRLSVYLLVMLFFLLVPSTSNLAFAIENPSNARASGALAVIFFFAALPLALSASRLQRALAGLPRLAPYRGLATALLVAIPLLAAARLNYVWYFERYHDAYSARMGNESEMGGVLRDFAGSVGDLRHAYIVDAPFWIDFRLVGITAGDLAWNNVLQREQISGVASDPAAKLFIVNQADRDSLDVLAATFPTGAQSNHRSRSPDKDFFLYFVPPRVG